MCVSMACHRRRSSGSAPALAVRSLAIDGSEIAVLEHDRLAAPLRKEAAVPGRLRRRPGWSRTWLHSSRRELNSRIVAGRYASGSGAFVRIERPGRRGSSMKPCRNTAPLWSSTMASYLPGAGRRPGPPSGGTGPSCASAAPGCSSEPPACPSPRSAPCSW